MKTAVAIPAGSQIEHVVLECPPAGVVKLELERQEKEKLWNL